MTRTDNIEKIKKACIAANSEIVINKHAQLIKFDRSVEYFEQTRPIRLADVLLATEMRSVLSGWQYVVDVCGDFYAIPNGVGVFPSTPLGRWNLRRDSLHDQTDEVISFIASLV